MSFENSALKRKVSKNQPQSNMEDVSVNCLYGEHKLDIVLKNGKTGECITAPYSAKIIDYGAKHFWKCDKSFFDKLCLFGTANSKVLAYVVTHVRPSSNQFVGAYKNIAKKISCDAETVRKAFGIMRDNDILAYSNAEKIWMLNPRLLVKGDAVKRAKLMSLYDTLLGRKLSDVILTDTGGNEPVYLSREYSSTHSLLEQHEDFFKLYNGFFDIIAGLSGKDFEVLRYLLMAMNHSDNMYIGTMQKIAQNCNCSRATVCRAMKNLTQKELMVMSIKSCWLINPSIIIKGNGNKERMLMEQFVEEQTYFKEKLAQRKSNNLSNAEKNLKDTVQN